LKLGHVTFCAFGACLGLCQAKNVLGRIGRTILRAMRRRR
jgi:hypothetical protein